MSAIPMTADEMRSARQRMNEVLAATISDFESATGMRVSRIDLFRNQCVDGSDTLMAINAEVSL